jgi:two-component system, NarL family, response regulator LiaR
MTLRILLVDDHPVVRAGLRALLVRELDCEVVGEADNGVAALDVARQVRPDIVVTDLLLPGADGVAVTHSIRAELPDVQVIILTGANPDDASVTRAVQAGAIGYVFKDADAGQLVNSIRSAASGRPHVSPRAAARLMDELRRPRTMVRLTERQRQVLREIAVGRSNKEIAQALHLGVSTVKSHVRTILEKLDVETRTQAALQAVHQHVLALDDLQL